MLSTALHATSTLGECSKRRVPQRLLPSVCHTTTPHPRHAPIPPHALIPPSSLQGEYSNEECPQFEFTGEYLQAEARPPSSAEGAPLPVDGAIWAPVARVLSLQGLAVCACGPAELVGVILLGRGSARKPWLPSNWVPPPPLSWRSGRAGRRLLALVLPRPAPAAGQGEPARLNLPCSRPGAALSAPRLAPPAATVESCTCRAPIMFLTAIVPPFPPAPAPLSCSRVPADLPS